MAGVLAERARVVAEARLEPLATRLAHVRGVAAAAERLVSRIDPLEADALIAAAWLHDVGYAPSLCATGFHPVDGAAFVRAENFPPLVVSLVAYHTGAVFEARELACRTCWGSSRSHRIFAGLIDLCRHDDRPGRFADAPRRSDQRNPVAVSR